MKFIGTFCFLKSFEELAKCSQNMSCGQCEVSKRLAYRHILKSIVKKLEEKNQKLEALFELFYSLPKFIHVWRDFELYPESNFTFF